MRPKVLFVSEAVSLAHMARPCVLASSLDVCEYNIHLGSNGQFPFCHASLPWTKHELPGISPQVFLSRLAAGRPVYTESELEQYVEDDLKLISTVQPDLIIGDFRLSLGISARHAGVPLLSICNAHWSPHRPRQRMPTPDLLIGRLIGHGLLGQMFNMVWPIASKAHTRAANRVRRRYGLPIHESVNDLYCDGDIVMYADSPALVPILDLPKNHVFLGPIVWSPPEKTLPEWWDGLARGSDHPIYVTLGTTGNVDLLPEVVTACRALEIKCLVATAGRSGFASTPPWVYAEAFLPGSEAAAISSLVICNGGSATAHQALAQGRPVLGICSNLDQMLTMESIASAGAGKFFRASEASPAKLRVAIEEMRANPRYGESARRIQAAFAKVNPVKRFPILVKCACSQGVAVDLSGIL
jgi:UDP:flavonoid glycosyltransferase YjiC (YdhE family)